MSSAIEVLKSKKSNCDLCKYDNGKSCDASGGEFGECKPADDFYKAIQEAIVALEQKENLKEWLEKEIEIIKQTQEEYGNKVLHEEIRKNILKEVLERVGEKK